MKLLHKLAQAATPVSADLAYSIRHDGNTTRHMLEDMMVLQGRCLAQQNIARAPLKSLNDAEFKVFSQFGEDGVIQYLIHATNIQPHEESFIEFGVQNYMESSTRFLLVNNNWRGLIFDGDAHHIAAAQAHPMHWRHTLVAQQAWITRENINSLISHAGFGGDIGLLGVDIDGNDYWVWQAINVANPVIVLVEYNSHFGPKAPVTIPYHEKFQRDQAHYSWIYYGASITALAELGDQKGYALVASNNAGNNLFFVRKDRLGNIPHLSPAQAWKQARFREARNMAGQLSFADFAERQKDISSQPLINTRTNAPTTLQQEMGV